MAPSSDSRSAAAPAIELRNVVKSFSTGARTVTAVDGISLSIPAGRFATVVGPSGCGKSTLLMMVAGLEAPTGGEVRIQGEALRGPSPERIGMVFQDATLLPWKTAMGNIEFPLELAGVPRERREQRSRELLGLVGLDKFGGHFPHELSGGMRQRIGIARGLAHDPTILLMDEPFSALDEQNRMRMGEELLRIWEMTGKTVFFITHSLIEAIYLSEVVFVMGPGRLVDVIEVDFPRPRSLDLVGSEKFGRIRNHIWHLISAAQA